MGRGRFVVVEGIDFGGKTTQIERLGKRLNAKIEKFPNRNSRIGQIIDDHLTEKDSIRSIKAEHLLMAANRAEVQRHSVLQNQHLSALYGTLEETCNRVKEDIALWLNCYWGWTSKTST